METTHFGPSEAVGLFSPTGFDDYFERTARRAGRLARFATPVDLPATIELPTDRPVIVAANHSSLYDLVASLITVDHYGAQARLGVHARFFRFPGAGRFLRRLGCIPFSRELSDTAEQSMIKALIDGQMCCLMPEGRIIRRDERTNGVGNGRPGISRIARAAGAAVLPVGFAGSDRAWPPGTPLIRIRSSRPVVATIGSPFEFDGEDHEANAAELMARIAKLVAAGVKPS